MRRCKKKKPQKDPGPAPATEPKCRLVQAGPVEVPSDAPRIDDPNAPAFAAKVFVQVSRQLGPHGVAVIARDNVFVVQVAGQLPYGVRTALELQAFAGGFLRGRGALPDPRQGVNSEVKPGEETEANP